MGFNQIRRAPKSWGEERGKKNLKKIKKKKKKKENIYILDW